MRILAVIFIFSLSIASTSYADLKIYRVGKSPGIRKYVTIMGISKSWKLDCTEQTTGKGKGTKRCELEPTTGKVVGNKPVYQSKSGPEVTLRFTPGDHFPFFGPALCDFSGFLTTSHFLVRHYATFRASDHFPFFGPALCDFSGFNGWLFFRGSQRKFFRRFIT